MLLSLFVSLLALGVGAHADPSVSLCVLCRHEAGEEANVPRSHLLSRFIRQSVAPRRNLAIGTFASVGQELLGIPSANEEDVLFGTTVVLSSLDGSRLAIGAPMHDYSTAEADDPSLIHI